MRVRPGGLGTPDSGTVAWSRSSTLISLKSQSRSVIFVCRHAGFLFIYSLFLSSEHGEVEWFNFYRNKVDIQMIILSVIKPQMWPGGVLSFCAPDLRVDSALSLPPGLPSSVLFLCVRQADCSGDHTHARSLCSAAVTAMKAALKVTSVLNLLVKVSYMGADQPMLGRSSLTENH